MHNGTGMEYKDGLLFAQATVKGFGKPWPIQLTQERLAIMPDVFLLWWNQQYGDALKAHQSNKITVRLATGTRVTAPKVPLKLGMKCLDFDSVEYCLVLVLGSKWDLILGMAWLELHVPWFDWRSKTLPATGNVPSKGLGSHKPTFARQQTRFWH